MVERNSYLNPPSTGEERSLYTLLAFSVLAHIMFFVIDKAEFFKSEYKPLFEEWSIEAEIVSDFGPTNEDTALPKAKPEEEAAVPDNMLPQLPKKFQIDSEKKDAGDLGETESDKVGLDQSKSNEEKKLDIENDPNEANKLKMEDALKRLALEKLRKDEKIAKNLQAEKNDPLARLRKELERGDKNISSSNSSILSIYRNKLRTHVGKFWTVPEAYNLKNSDLKVVIAIIVDGQGDLRSSLIKQSSGDSVFDALAQNAIKNAAPMPAPPRGQAGEEILMKFTPRSF